jgi:hypothetical protein
VTWSGGINRTARKDTALLLAGTLGLDGTSLAQSRSSLDELYDQHLITESAPGRYRLHDLLREHARALAATDDPADRDAAAGRLLDYYLHTALAAGQHFDTWATTFRQEPPGSPPAQTPDLTAFGQSVAWLEAERANLYAPADYAATRRQPWPGRRIPAAGAHDLPAHRRPRRPAHRGNPPRTQPAGKHRMTCRTPGRFAPEPGQNPLT